MNTRSVCQWLHRVDERVRAVMRWSQPMTALQMARRDGLSLDRAGYLVWTLGERRVVLCLNPLAAKSRVYWLTALGKDCQRRLRHVVRLAAMSHAFPRVDWTLYGWVCFRHRGAIIRTLSRPMQPSEIKRHARRQDDTLRMSANNTRDVIKLLLQRGVVERVEVPREPHPRYQLTPVGRDLRQLLLGAEAPSRP